MSLLRDLGMNAIRLRVWVNPENDTDDVRGWCNKGDVLLKAWRAHNLGYRIMIDFHYSDRWADPSQQAKPQAWADYSVEQLKQAIADHTKDVLSALKEKGIDVEWVQVGNETHQGMLFPTGQTTSEEGRVNFASFVTAGYDGVKEVYPKLLFILTKEIMPAYTIGSSATYTKTMPNGTSSVCHFIRTYQPKTHTHRTTGKR